MDYAVSYIDPKHNSIENRDHSQAERLSRSRSQISFMRRLLDQIENTTNRVSDLVDDEVLLQYAKAIDMALKAVENAAFFGDSGYAPHILTNYNYKWDN